MYKGLGINKKEKFDSSRPIKAIPQIGDSFPKAKTLKEFMDSAFYPFIEAKLLLNSIGVATYQEIGTTPNITITADTIANDETKFLSAIQVLENNVQVGEIEGTNGNLVLALRDSNADYQLRMQVGNDGTPKQIVSNIKPLRFIYPYFYGKKTTGALPTEAEILESTKVVALSNSTITINPNTTGTELGFIVVEHSQSKNFTHWKVTELNQGSVGAGQFIEKKGTVQVNGRDYDIYMYNYASELTNNVTLS